MIGPTTVAPSPWITLTTPGGKDSRIASSSGRWSSAPYFGSFDTTVLPISAGTSVV